MPSKAKANSLQRLLQLLAVMPAGRLATPSDLQRDLAGKGFSVDTRTIQRDLRLLQQHFALECDERSKPHGWRWRSAGARDSVLGLSTPEALGLVLLEQHLQSALPASWSGSLADLFTQARASLDKLGPLNGAKRWPAKVHVVPPGLGLRLPALPSTEVLSEVAEALLNDRQLQLQYSKPGQSQAVTYLVHPLGLLLRGHAVYLVGLSDADRNDQARHFALHRIASADMLHKASAVPSGIDMSSAMAQSSGHFGTSRDAQPVDLLLYCEAGLAQLLEESPLCDEQQLAPIADGRFEVRAQLPVSWELRWWLLAHIAELEVVSPAPLREDIRKVLERAAHQHRSSA